MHTHPISPVSLDNPNTHTVVITATVHQYAWFFFLFLDPGN